MESRRDNDIKQRKDLNADTLFSLIRSSLAVYRKFCKFELALYPFSSAQRTRMHSQWLIYSHS